MMQCGKSLTLMRLQTDCGNKQMRGGVATKFVINKSFYRLVENHLYMSTSSEAPSAALHICC
jgi:hypothetical protein